MGALNSFCGSEFWNTTSVWKTDDPDFTSCFEKTILVWVPFLCLIVFSPVDIYYIVHSKCRPIPLGFLNATKLVLVTGLIILCITEFIYSAVVSSSKIHAVDIYTPIIKGLMFAYVLLLMLLNKSRGIHTSGLLFLFWLLLAVAGLPQFRSEIRKDIAGTLDETLFQFVCYIMYYVIVLVLFLLNFFAEPVSRYHSHPKGKEPSPEGTASFFSRLTFMWFDKMVWLGHRQPLTEDDLWNINKEDTSDSVVPMFTKHWNARAMKNARQGKSYGKVNTLMVIWKCFGPMFLIISLLKIVGDMMSFFSPILLRYMIVFVSGNESMWHGYLYAVLLFLSAEIQTLLLSVNQLQTFVVGLRIRTALVSVIYRKAMRISNATKKDTTSGEIVNLMAVDAQRFFDLAPFIGTLFSAPFQILLATYLLWETLGWSAFVGIAVLILVIPINIYMANCVKILQAKQMKLKDQRVKLMNEILCGIKVLKLYAWEQSYEEQIKMIRQKEMIYLRKIYYLNASGSFVWTCSPFLVGLVAFVVYIYNDQHHILNAEISFVSLSLFNIIRMPIVIIPLLVTLIVQTSVSVKRINRFLNSGELDPNAVSHDETRNDPLIIENGTFLWGGNSKERPTLRNINIKVKNGALVAVVGVVGSGKSSLISAFLGEMDKISGFVNTKGSIAYVPQQAWVQNATVRDNILFGHEINKRRYVETIKACALKQDLEMFIAGENTEIGEKGINISGGQKQRISLARAVYSDADVYFLDDPLSAVDSHVGKHIFENVIGPKGVLNGKTRLLVTHGVTYLASVDLILVMKDGEISESGTYKELIAKKGAFADFLIEHMTETEDVDEEKVLEGIIGQDNELIERYNRQVSFRGNGSVRSRRSSRRDSESSSVNLQLSTKMYEENKLIETEKSETGNVKLSVYMHYFKSAGAFMTLVTIILAISVQVFTVLGQMWLSRWSTDTTLIVNGVQDRPKNVYYIGIYTLFGFCQILSVVLQSFSLALATLAAARWLHLVILSGVMRAPMKFFDTTPTGRIINRFSKDIDVIDTLLPGNLSGFLGCLCSTISILFVISFSTPIFVLVIIPVGIIYYFVQRYYIAIYRQLKRLESVSRSPIYSHFSESISGASSIRAHQVQDRFIKQCEEKVDFNQLCIYPSIIAIRWVSTRLETLGNIIILFAAIFAVLGRDTLDSGIVGLSVSYALQVTIFLNYLVRIASDVETNIVSVERLKEYTEVPQEAAWWVTPRPDASWPKIGRVEFINYAVRYREGLDLVLKGISCTIEGGEKIGIVGRTGAGKSSLTLGLFRIIEAARGSIVIDDIDISKIGLNDLRSKLTIIPQDPVLFSGTLRSNLDPFGSYSDDVIWRSLELAHLSDFVHSLDAGLDYQVSESGENLSVGQRQLICLARALLRKTKVLVLDEATAAVDLETDDLIQRTIRTEFKECTVLTIAHRLNTILDSDRVIVLDKGYITEFDSPSALLKSKSSTFYSMARDAGIV